MSIQPGSPGNGQVVCKDFPGLIDNMDPRDLPPGAAEDQVNLACVLVGELTVRLGYKEVSFDTGF